MTDTLTGTSNEACVQSGLALLSERFDGWQRYIDRDRLNMMFGHTCILGQLNAEDPRFGDKVPDDPCDNYVEACAVIFPEIDDPRSADMRVVAALHGFTAPLHMGADWDATTDYFNILTGLWLEVLDSEAI